MEWTLQPSKWPPLCVRCGLALVRCGLGFKVCDVCDAELYDPETNEVVGRIEG